MVAAFALTGDAVTLDAFAGTLQREPTKLAVLLGTEGDGLSRLWSDQADAVVRIPMRAGIDSLNVAAAAAIACYALAERPQAADPRGVTGQSAG